MLVSITFPELEEYSNNLPTGYGFNHEYTQSLSRKQNQLRQEFLEYMSQEFGEIDKKWGIRWNDFGADIRFSDSEDATGFYMFSVK